MDAKSIFEGIVGTVEVLIFFAVLYFLFGSWILIRVDSYLLSIDKNSEPAQAIYIPEKLVDTFGSKFKTDTSEFRFCLFGKHYKDGILITDYYQPIVTSTSPEGIEAMPCGFDSLGLIHSHPNGACGLSYGDISTLGKSSDLIMGSICSEKYYYFVTKAETKSLPVYDVNADGTVLSQLNELTCPSGKELCNDQCWDACPQGTFRCLPTGADCLISNGPSRTT